MSWKYSHPSVKKKLIKMSMVTSIIAVVLTCSLFVVYGIANTRVMVIKELSLISQIIGNRAGPALDWGDKETAQKSLDDLRIKDSIVVACIYDSTGKIFTSYLGDIKSNCPLLLSNGVISIGWDKLAIYNNIIFHGAKVGIVYIESDIRDIIKEIPNYIGFAFILLFIIGIISYIITSYYQKFISKPILHLVDTTYDIINQNHYTTRAQKFDNDEIGTLADSFNNMLSKIQSRDQELKEVNETLEQRVKARTHELEQAKLRAETSNQAKTEFLRNMSHEFRTPLHAMSSFSIYGIKEAETADRAELHKYFTRISTGTSRLLKLVDGLLSLAKLESGQEIFLMERGNLAAAVETVLAEEQSLILDKQITVNVKPTTVNTEAVFDNDKIIQVITNILGNAIKFTPKGKTITLYFGQTVLQNPTRANTPLPCLTLSISDQGIGIPPDELQKIFDKFVQSSRTNTGAGGTGLGLAIAQHIMKGHGGTIHVQNNTDIGTTFTLILPYMILPGKKVVNFAPQDQGEQPTSTQTI